MFSNIIFKLFLYFKQPPLTLDPNIYSTKKTVMTILCLIIIIMANSIQLKFVIKNAGAIHSQFYSAQVGLGITSVLLATFIGKNSFFIFFIVWCNVKLKSYLNCKNL